jgi:hypothetical protein
LKPVRIGENESAIIAERDGFYLATVSETVHPYVQFRGGPRSMNTSTNSKSKSRG